MESGRLLAHSDEPSAASKPGDGCGRGGWRAALFIIAVGFLERIGFYGVQGNLIMYLAGPMGMSMAAAAAAANAWGGMVMVLTLVGALAADSHLGRYRALVAAGVLYLLSLGMLTVSSTLQPTHPHPASCNDGATACSPPPSPTARLALFHAALYLLALAQGFHKPCSEAFGADQFAATTTPARTRRGAPTSTGFTSPHPGATGYAVATTLLSYAEDNVSWTVRFDVCWATMVVYLAVFLLGTATYRAEPIDGAPLARLAETSARGCARVDEEGILPEGCHLHRTASEVEDGKGFVQGRIKKKWISLCSPSRAARWTGTSAWAWSCRPPRCSSPSASPSSPCCRSTTAPSCRSRGTSPGTPRASPRSSALAPAWPCRASPWSWRHSSRRNGSASRATPD